MMLPFLRSAAYYLGKYFTAKCESLTRRTPPRLRPAIPPRHRAARCPGRAGGRARSGERRGEGGPSSRFVARIRVPQIRVPRRTARAGATLVEVKRVYQSVTRAVSNRSTSYPPGGVDGVIRDGSPSYRTPFCKKQKSPVFMRLRAWSPLASP
jgi:hypothetical protein